MNQAARIKGPTVVERSGETSAEIDALRQNEERLRLMVEAVRDYAIFMLDPEGRIQSWNTGAERLKGYTAAEIIGRHFSVFYTDEARSAGHPDFELELAKRDGRYEEEGWRIRKDGTRFCANVVITAVHDRGGQLIGFTKVTRDITERREAAELLRASEERMRLLVESVRDYAIFMLDEQGRITTWNAGAQRIKGYEAAEVIGQHFSIFYPAQDRALGRPERELRIATAEGRYEEEGWRVRKDGEPFWASVVLTAIRGSDGALRGFAKVTRDLTERRRAEQATREAELKAVEERARVNEARSAVKQRDEFISIAAHELRTPISALQLKVQSVTRALIKAADEPGGCDTPKLASRLEGAGQQVKRLIDLVDRLVDVSRIVDGRLVLNPEPLDLTALVTQVVDDFRGLATEAGCDLQLQPGGPISGVWDRARIEQVVINLLSNAVKYGAGKPIRVQVEAAASCARLVVADQGIGIAPEDIERVFARFERAVPVRHYGGLGLGLYVVRNIVEAHGGKIEVSSSPGAGSTFEVALPSQGARS